MKFIAKTLYGLEDVLAAELTKLGASEVRKVNRGVLFSGSNELMYRVNYCSRTSLSILRLVENFRIASKDDLYRKTSGIDWSAIMNAESTFSIVPVVNSSLFTHTGYPALIAKDAIADYFRKKTGKRPSVDTSDPDIIINLHISGDNTDISIDSSGMPLFKRGYRTGQPLAPLNEVLAAGILMMSGWDGSAPLTDPMCGSGTIPVEAGLIACRVPPGKFRKEFGFMKWKDFDETLFLKVREQNNSMIRKSPVCINGSDISEQAVRQSFNNIRNAGLTGSVTIEVADFRDLRPAEEAGFLFINPPYGERLRPDDLNELYSMIGTTLKHSFPGHKAWIITPGKDLLANIGLKPRSKQILFNGSLECILAEFELYSGTKKHSK
ncbi:MAG: class I SAM-dependent RNA methyltransferase [Bacteroidota bacterium]